MLELEGHECDCSFQDCNTLLPHREVLGPKFWLLDCICTFFKDMAYSQHGHVDLMVNSREGMSILKFFELLPSRHLKKFGFLSIHAAFPCLKCARSDASPQWMEGGS